MSAMPVRSEWPHSHGDDPRLGEGNALSPDELETIPESAVFVRCYDCRGGGCDSCGQTGFDWSDTADVRATVRALHLLEADAWERESAASRCHIHMRSLPPYVGGDDDEITGWQAECCACGWRGRDTKHQAVAYTEAIEHLHAALNPGAAHRP